MVGILTTATLFCWTNVQDCKNTSSWYSRYYFDTPPHVPLCFFVHFPFSHRPWDADILSCACSFMFTADSMRGTNLDDTRIFRPVMRKQRCKVFFRVQSTEYRVQMTDDRWQMTEYRWQMTQIWQIYTEDVQHFSQSRWGAAEVIRGQSIFFVLFHSKSA